MRGVAHAKEKEAHMPTGVDHWLVVFPNRKSGAHFF
jgi:hypothetical protein